MLGLTAKTRIYQASTSELYCLVQEIPQKEATPLARLQEVVLLTADQKSMALASLELP